MLLNIKKWIILVGRKNCITLSLKENIRGDETYG